MHFTIEKSWQVELQAELTSQYFKDLEAFVNYEYQTQLCFPPYDQIFAAFEHTSFIEVKVVIIGQDPYHGYGQANGLCFSVSQSAKIPNSLINIFKERTNDVDVPFPTHGNLMQWAKQGVLLLNATLTVREGQAGSHQKKGWETFTDSVICILSEKKENLVFILWGAYAQEKKSLINVEKHFVIESVHPSPLSAYRGFFGSKPFSKTNNYLKSKGKSTIEW